MSRRLPLYLLLDTSGSMSGEPIQALNNGLSVLVNTLRTDPVASESLWVSVITFDREVKEVLPLTALQYLQLPDITCPSSGPTMTGKALSFLSNKVKQDIKKATPEKKGDWRPLLIILTDGKASDTYLFEEMIEQIKALNFGAILACAAGQLSDYTQLQTLTDNVVHLESLDSGSLSAFFVWVSDTIEQNSKSIGRDAKVQLPPPPSEEFIIT